MKKRALMIVLAIFFTWIVIFLVLAAVQINKYIKVQKVCRDLHEGTYIHSDIGDGTTCPLWLHYIMLPNDMFTVETPLTAACYELNYDAVCEILANGADPNRSIFAYWSPLEATYVTPTKNGKSCAKERLAITLKLFEYGAHLEEENVQYLNKIMRFLYSHQEDSNDIAECIKVLVSHGASLTDDKGYSLIHSAAIYNSVILCDLAINEYGFTVEEKSNNGRTPLFCTTYHNGIETARYLIEKGASKSVIDNNGKTAYDYALEKGYLELAELLRP